MPQTMDARVSELSNIPEHTADVATHQREAMHPGTHEDKNWETKPTQPAPVAAKLVHGKAASIAAKRTKAQGELQAQAGQQASAGNKSGRIAPVMGFGLGALGVGLAVLAISKSRG